MIGTKLSASVRDAANQRYTLPHPTRMELIRSLDSPAANLSVSFPVERRSENILDVSLNADNNNLFDGKIDEQGFTVSQGGRLLTLEARDRGGAPLDNEAMPQTLWGANAATMFSRLLRQHGFELHNTMPARILPVFTIYKGMSEWDAFAAFVTQMHGIAPHVEGRLVVVGRPRPGTRMVFSNTKQNCIPFTTLTHRRVPYRMISRVIMRDADGWYSSAYTNTAASFHGVSRTRYVIPPTEFIDNPGLDAKLRINRAQYRSDEVVIRCPGLLFMYPGQQCAVEDSSFSQQNVHVDKIRHIVSDAGMFTELNLCQWLYYS
ncbi:MAG: hypothetical protein FWH00_00405 [Oscillospiraceae bacterium]|nr:hypothetical protein [Oscillospiraceae bacterium]